MLKNKVNTATLYLVAIAMLVSVCPRHACAGEADEEVTGYARSNSGVISVSAASFTPVNRATVLSSSGSSAASATVTKDTDATATTGTVYSTVVAATGSVISARITDSQGNGVSGITVKAVTLYNYLGKNITCPTCGGSGTSSSEGNGYDSISASTDSNGNYSLDTSTVVSDCRACCSNCAILGIYVTGASDYSFEDMGSGNFRAASTSSDTIGNTEPNLTSKTNSSLVTSGSTAVATEPSTIGQAYAKLEDLYDSLGCHPAETGNSSEDITDQGNNTVTNVYRNEHLSPDYGGFVSEGITTRVIGGSTQSSIQIQTYYDAQGTITSYGYYEFLGFGTDQNGNRTSTSISTSFDAAETKTGSMLDTYTTITETGLRYEKREYYDQNDQKECDTLQGSSLEYAVSAITGVTTEPAVSGSDTDIKTSSEANKAASELSTMTSLTTYSNSESLKKDFSAAEPYYMRIKYYSSSSQSTPISIYQLLEHRTDETGAEYYKEEITYYDPQGNISRIDYIAHASDAVSSVEDTYSEYYTCLGAKTKDEWSKAYYKNGVKAHSFLETKTYDENGKETVYDFTENG